MEKSTKVTANVIAMDLGTSNTCIAACQTGFQSIEITSPNSVTVIKPERWHNPALGGAIPTLVLYNDNVPFLIGSAAEYEFGEASASERKSYSLHSQFKPDIAVDERAKGYMLDFLRLLRGGLQMPDMNAAENHLLVGIPSQAENHYQQVLRQCLQSTGWHNAQFLREPMGALLHYIANGQLPPSVAARGVITVDFGGGTCDFAYLRRADVVSRHGDMLYGGRLFDDLFYQVLLAHNPGLEARLQAEGNDYYVHWVACRRAKEEFSAAMHENRSKALTVRVRWSYFDGRKSVESSAYIENFTWENFLEHAGKYVASDDLLQLLQEHAQRAGISQQGQGLLQGKQVDLISWFEELFFATCSKARHMSVPSAHEQPENAAGASPFADKPLILLTGGSSAWPFVLDVVRSVLGVDVKILLGDEPYADIAKGLAQYNMLAMHLREGREALQAELPRFMQERILRRAIKRILENGSEMLMQELGDFLRDVILLPEFRFYREKGGSLLQLMEGIGKTLVAEKERVQNLLDAAMTRMGRQIVQACREELKDWFHEKGIPIVPERLEHTWIALAMHDFISDMAQNLGKSTLSNDRTAAEMAAMVAAPGLAALAASGAPLTATVLGLGGLVLMKVFNLDKWVVNKILYVPVPGILRKRLFSEGRLVKLCNDQLQAFGAEFKKQILQSWKESEGKIMAEAARVAEEEIASLDILNITPA